MKHYFTKKTIITFCAIANVTIVYCSSGDFSCIGTCYSGQVAPESQDIFHGWHLKGYSCKNTTTDNPIKCYSSCTQDCRCKACQMQDKRCELLEEDKSSKSSDFVAAPRYVYYDIKQTLYHGAYHMLPPGKCHNGCCSRSQPCMNGGTCIEHCHDPKIKFTCECPSNYGGKVCDKYTSSESCLAVLKLMRNAQDGVYHIVNSLTGTVLPHFCSFDRTSQPATAWTLIESQSLANKHEFFNKTFYDNTSINTLSPPSWDRYRLAPEAIKYLRPKVTLFRATCDFPYRSGSSLLHDYLLARLSDIDITSSRKFGGTCMTFLRININGFECTQCTAPLYGNQLKIVQHLHIDNSWVSSCTFAATLKRDANYFGFYGDTQIDTTFTCTHTQQSTTQWWLGEQGL